jgi:YidC/Oxa1 family membrane protein insertase
MQGLRPKIEEVQARYADDKERLQRELMKVYSEAGVNPLGGCLPILLQMPILVGLFIAFQNAIALRGVPFILWIKDLSVPDTAFYLLGIPFNPLPLIMAATMFFQQKLSPMPSADPVQKQMLYMMPVMMTVLFYNFPSGLSLYWVTQNILSIGQQYYMMRIREVPSK